ASEIAHMTAGDVVCAAPTATHERGDDAWTAEEHTAALSAAPKVYDPRRVVTADAVGAGFGLDAGAPAEPLASLLVRFFAAIEGSARATSGVGYVRLRPRSIVRAQVVRTAANTWEKAHRPRESP